MSILVTGGTGYIGSHVVAMLRERGDEVVVIDDLETGFAERIGDVPLRELDLAAPDASEQIECVLREHAVERVVHFAARKQVGESVERPLWYHEQNTGGMLALLRAMRDAGVGELVFSSSAAVYGMGAGQDRVREDDPTVPVNPYGETKLAGERIIEGMITAGQLRATSLRYFNVAGCGERRLADRVALNLIPMVIERLLRDEAPRVFGDDYPTPDGTCIRDYVHVSDLAEAHLVALDRLASGDELSSAYNVGTGLGSSVLEVVQAVREASGRDIEPVVVDRRPGDPPALVGDVERIREQLGWSAKRGLPEMAASAWDAMAAQAGVL